MPNTRLSRVRQLHRRSPPRLPLPLPAVKPPRPQPLPTCPGANQDDGREWDAPGYDPLECAPGEDACRCP